MGNVGSLCIVLLLMKKSLTMVFERLRSCDRFSVWLMLCLTTLLWFPPTVASANEIERMIETIQAVGPSGQGNREAAAAWQRLTKSEAEELPTILAGLDDCSPLAANWIRAAVDTVAERELARTGTLPANSLQQFVLDTRHDSRARRLAFEWLIQVDETAADRLIPNMLRDPGVEFRRDAVARLLTEADVLFKEASRRPETIKLYRKALEGARDDDQVQSVVARLKELDQQVDVPRHFGFLIDWKVIAPFDNTGNKGLDIAYPPEKEIRLDASCDGKDGPISWIDYSTDDDYGMVDFNQPFGKLKEVVGYAFTEFTSDQQRDVELRLGCKNAWKVWLNGELLFERGEYHQGMRMDQYDMPCVMQRGRNSMLVKLCQDEQTHSWTVQWQFQLRVCDATGTAMLSTSRGVAQAGRGPGQQSAVAPVGEK